MLRYTLVLALLIISLNTQAQRDSAIAVTAYPSDQRETVSLHLATPRQHAAQNSPLTAPTAEVAYAVTEGAEIDYAAVSRSVRAGRNVAQTNEAAPFTATIVDLPPLTVIAGKAPWLPPYPEKPDATIEGVDVDRDCVRDDMEHYIAKKFRRADQHQLRKYLYEYVAWTSRFMYSNLSVNTGRTSFNNMAALSKCVRQIMDDDLAADKLLEDLFGEFHNTYPRSHRYVDNLPRIGGWTNREKISVFCP